MRTTLLKFVLLFSLVLLNTSLSTGQIQYNNIRFKQLSIAEGLPHNTINAITQDNHGFIWFGTRNGLCRYDGYNINLFAHNEADSTSLRHNFITRLYNIRSVTFYGSLPIRASAAITTRQKISAVTRLKGTLRMMFVS